VIGKCNTICVDHQLCMCFSIVKFLYIEVSILYQYARGVYKTTNDTILTA